MTSPLRSCSPPVSNRIPAQGKQASQPGQKRHVSYHRHVCAVASLLCIHGPPSAALPALLQHPHALVAPAAAQPGLQGCEPAPSFIRFCFGSSRLFFFFVSPTCLSPQVSNPCGGSPQSARPPVSCRQQPGPSVDPRLGTSNGLSPRGERHIQVGFQRLLIKMRLIQKEINLDE